MTDHHRKAWRLLTRLVDDGCPVEVGLKRLIRQASKAFPSAQWSSIKLESYGHPDSGLSKWLSEVLRKEPPSSRINAFWFGLYHPTSRGSDVYVAGSDQFDPSDTTADWASAPAWWPGGRYANSRGLFQLFKSLRRFPSEARQFAEWLLLLGYAALSVARLCRVLDADLLLGRRRERAIAVGFDDGDFLVLGSLTRSGLKPIPKAKKEPRVPRSLFYEVKQSASLDNAWLLDEPLSALKKELPVGFGTEGKPYDGPIPLHMMIHTSGTPLDVSFSILAAPVVSGRGARIFTKLASKDIQLIPVVIGKLTRRYYMLNVTRQIDALDWSRSKIIARYVASAVLKKSAVGKSDVFRVKEGNSLTFFVSARMYQAMRRAGLSGMTFIPIASS